MSMVYAVSGLIIFNSDLAKNMYYNISGCFYRKQVRKEMFYLSTHSTHFIYGYIASGIW